MRRAGFTLIEMIVVIAIIGILAAMTMPSVSMLTDKAKKARAQADVRAIGTGAIVYKMDNGVWPDASAAGWSQHCGIRHLLDNFLMPQGTAGRKRYLSKYPWPDPYGNNCGFIYRVRPDGWYSFVLCRGQDRSPNSCYYYYNKVAGDDVVCFLD